MARFDTSGMDDLIRDMERMGQLSGEVAKVMVEAAAQEIKAAWKESAEDHGLRDTGAMIESIDAPGPVMDFGTALGKDIYPTGKDRKGVRNAEKAFILHYGTSRIRASYWWSMAEQEADPRVIAAMRAIWDEWNASGEIPQGGSAGVYVARTKK